MNNLCTIIAHISQNIQNNVYDNYPLKTSHVIDRVNRQVFDPKSILLRCLFIARDRAINNCLTAAYQLITILAYVVCLFVPSDHLRVVCQLAPILRLLRCSLASSPLLVHCAWQAAYRWRMEPAKVGGEGGHGDALVGGQLRGVVCGEVVFVLTGGAAVAVCTAVCRLHPTATAVGRYDVTNMLLYIISCYYL